jgi:hypothetical protein
MSVPVNKDVYTWHTVLNWLNAVHGVPLPSEGNAVHVHGVLLLTELHVFLEMK